MEQWLGVVAKVEVPTDWCVGMVVVPKPDGTKPIHVDKLNESRECVTFSTCSGADPGTACWIPGVHKTGRWLWFLADSDLRWLLTADIVPDSILETLEPKHFQWKMAALHNGIEGSSGVYDGQYSGITMEKIIHSKFHSIWKQQVHTQQREV